MLKVTIEDIEDKYDIYAELVVKHNDVEIFRAHDIMEPEDVSFYRSLSWVDGIIEKAYKLGVQDGQKGKRD